MPSRLRWKWILIACVLLACIAAVIQFPKSKKELVNNWNKNIRLGLDLKGGSQIVMQIQLQDAFKVEADRAIERINEALKRREQIRCRSDEAGVCISFLIDRVIWCLVFAALYTFLAWICSPDAAVIFFAA